MLFDTKSLKNGDIIEADVCIIGAGPAGTTAAQEFLGSDLKVVLLESGGHKEDHRVQKLSEGELSGDLYEPMEDTHLRQVGGTGNHWIIKMADQQFGFRYAPLKPIDFKKRDCVPHSGWPISREDLDPYYARAHDVCKVGPYKYEPDDWDRGEFETLPLDENVVRSDFFSFGPTGMFVTEFPEAIGESDNVDIYTNATVVELLNDEADSSISSALVRTFDGKDIRFKAKEFIISAGGYTSARILLASNRKNPAGLGNEHDVVGRYLMDHSLVPSGNFYLHDRQLINKLGVYDMRLLEGASILGKLAFTEEALEREGLKNFTATLFPMPKLYQVEALWSMREIAMALKGRRLPENFFKHAWTMFKGLPHIMHVLYEMYLHDAPLQPGFGQGGWSKSKKNHKKFERLELLAFVEQSPNPDNRVTLLDEKDELGCPKLKAHFEWPEGDLESMLKAQKIMGEQLEATGLGRFEPNIKDGKPEIGALGLHHIIGTTRMGDDPKTSVVDSNCKVHSLDNLYIASSSVFTTSGYANPTLTILALSIRVADEVKGKFNTVEI